MIEYEIGDSFIFSFDKNKRWILIEMNQKTYKFFDMWSGEIWTSHRTAPIHRCGPDFHFRNNKLIYKRKL